MAGDGTPVMRSSSRASADQMTLGIRPEDVDPAGGTHAASVRVVEDTGPTKVLIVRWAGQDVHVIVPAGTSVRAGDEILPRIDPSRAVLWPAHVAPEGPIKRE